MGELLRIVIVEDEQLIAKFLESWLATQPDCQVIGWGADAKSGWDLCIATEPNLVLLDIQLPGLDGLELGRRLLGRLPNVRLLALSGHTDPQTVWRACQSGVHGFIEKNLPPDLLMAAIRTVGSGEPFFSDAFESVKRQWLAQPDAFHKVLSEREQQVLQRVASGWDDNRIGAELTISAATVAVHRKHIRQKLDLHSDRELIGYARQWGLDKLVIPPLAQENLAGNQPLPTP
jgi:DNA-binding NarL/FixJ family response regulator